MNGQSLILVDGHSQIYRAYYAVRYLKTSDGRHSNAIFAMGKFLLTLEKAYPAEFGAFALDMGKPAFRMELAPDYKANRKPMPDELRSQIPVIREMIMAFGWPILEDPTLEADDILAGIAVKFDRYPVKIVSPDKDIAQIINERIHMLIPDRKKGFIDLDPEGVLAKFAVTPEQIVDYLSMLGDSSDNIPGVPGVGAKTAAKLLQEFGSIDNIYANLDAVANAKLKEKFLNAKDLLQKNRKLISLKLDLPEKNWELETIRKRQPDFARLLTLTEQFELKSIGKSIEELAESRGVSASGPQMVTESLFNSSSSPEEPMEPAKSADHVKPEKQELYTPDLFE